MSATILRLTALGVAILTLLSIAGTALANDTEIGIDADPQGNTANSLGEIDRCIEAAVGDTVEIDLYIKDVEALIAFEISLRYDPAILRLTDRDVREQFLASAEDSNIVDGSQKTPDSDGRYSVSAVNANDSSSGTTGSGVLARISLTAVATGISDLDLRTEDIDGDGKADRGALARNADGDAIDDNDDDSFFDGVLRNASVAVDAKCADAAPAVTGGDNDGSFLLWVIIAVVIAVIVIGGIGVLVLRRRASAGG